MSLSEFPDTPENFHGTPIKLEMLETTGSRAGDDGGYRDVPVCDAGDQLVDIGNDIMTRGSYDGYDEVTGEFNEKLVLQGGTDGGVYARKAVLEALKAANQYLTNRYGTNAMMIGVVDAFRSRKRQVAGFSRKAVEVLDGNQQPDVPTLYRAGTTADGTFSLVRAFRNDPVYTQFVSDMAASKEVIALAAELGKDADTVAVDLADVCANLRQGSNVVTPLNMNLPLNSNNNAHAGGGAVDVFLYDGNGRILNGHVPFDWVGPEAAMDFLEQDDSFDAFKERVKTSPMLKAHLEKQGITGDVTEAQWKIFRDTQRIIYHTLTAVGSTFFTDSAVNKNSPDFFGGENWHFEPGNVVYAAATNEVIYEAPSANVVRDGGNPGHTLQTKGKGVEAPWGGDAAHAELKRRGILLDS